MLVSPVSVYIYYVCVCVCLFVCVCIYLCILHRYADAGGHRMCSL